MVPNIPHLGDIMLADHMLSWLDLLGVSSDEDATALTAALWLADVSTDFSLPTIGLEVPIAVCRERLVRRFLCTTAVPGPCENLFAPPWVSASELHFF